MFSSDQWLANSGADFYNGVATQSARFDRGSTPYLNRTATLGNRKTWTFSTWLKRSGFTSAVQYIFGTNVSNNDATSANIHIGSDNTITVAPWANHFVKTTALLRDVGAWYHIVVDFDTTQAGTGNSTRVNIYINGVDQTLANGGATLSQNSDWAINLNQANTRVSGLYGDGNQLDGYLTETNFVDGLSLDASYFGETKNGVWIAKEPDVSDYGTNGFRLKYIGTGTATSSGAVTNPTNIGDDSSGKNNHFAVSGLVSSDSNMPDSPENNFSTMNAIQISAGTSTFSEGNLRLTHSGARSYNTSTFAVKTGKWYAEMRWDINNSGETNFIGIGSNPARILHHTTAGTLWWGSNGNGYIDGSEVSPSAFSGGVDWGQHNVQYPRFVLGVALDLDSSTRTVTFTKDGGNSFSKDLPASFTDHIVFCMTKYSSSGSSQSTWNFGQDSTFVAQETATSNADENGFGAFHTAPPSGYLSLCSANLSDATIDANSDTQADDHFEAVIYEGDGSVQNIAVNFQPDLTWIKNRDATDPHQLFDSSRGATFPFNLVGASKGDIANDDTLTDFIATGFTLGDDVNVNTNNESYVSWNWKAVATPSKTYKVVVVSDSGNKYRFRNSADSATFGTSAVTLNLQEGGTYTFDYSDSTATSHPFRFSTTSDGTHGGGSEYTTGVVKDDTAKTIKITVPASAPTLYYYCSAHSGMGGQANTNVTHGSTNFDGSILSVSQTNTDVGFSVVRYRGTGANGTFGHGVEVNGVPTSPAVMWFKHIQGEDSWAMWHHTGMTANNQYYPFNTVNPLVADGNMWNAGVPSTTVVNLGTNSIVNRGSPSNQGEFVCYCFAEVEGYSKFGVYYGNNDANGAFIFTNFKPAFVLTKRADGTGSNWYINDTARFLGNITTPLYIDSNSAESGNGIDILSNGFKIRNADASQNASNIKYIYMAFAEESFKYANAR